MSLFRRFASLAAAMLSFGSVAAAEPPRPPFEIAFQREDDRATTKYEEGRATIAIESPFGISRATIERTEEAWPAEMTLRLKLRGLERFVLKSAEIHAETTRRPDGLVLRGSVPRAGTEGEEAATPDTNDPLRTDVRSLDAAGRPTPEIPLPEGGCFEIRLPKALFEKNPKSIELEWVDFYRG